MTYGAEMEMIDQCYRELGRRTFERQGFTHDLISFSESFRDSELAQQLSDVASAELEWLRRQGVEQSTEVQFRKHCLSQIHLATAYAAGGWSEFRITDDLFTMLDLTALDPDVPALPLPGFRVVFPRDRIVTSDGGFPLTYGVFTSSAATDRDVYLNASVWFDSPRGKQKLSIAVGWDQQIDRGDCFGGLSGVDEAGALCSRIRHIVRGLCSFVQSEPARFENEKAVRRDRARGILRPSIFIAGQKIKIRPELRKFSIENRGRHPLWKLEHRYIVRGHWRWQPIGRRLAADEEGPVNTRKTWIEPHWKGPEGAEAWQHTYIPEASP